MHEPLTIDELIARLQEIKEQHHGGVRTDIFEVTAVWSLFGTPVLLVTTHKQ